MHKMRRSDRMLSDKQAVEILKNGEYGVLSTTGENGQPYGVPLNYVFSDNCIYFHAALKGHKLENIAFNDKVSFTVIGKTEVQPLEMTTLYESAIAFGKATLVKDGEKLIGLRALIEKYAPDHKDIGEEHIKRSFKACVIVKIEVSEITGKAKTEL